jgi:2,3-bisphosphoglycerate-independent phosphoglycerate mutase
MAEYEKGLDVNVAFHRPPKMKNILGEYLANNGLHQFRCAESEKAPHVTFFFNDYRESPEGPTRADEPIQGAFAGETQLEIPSPKEVATYDQKPEMSAEAVTEAILAELQVDRQDVYIVNFANGDMVGHTGSLPAAIKAVETVDHCVGQLVDEVLSRKGAVIVTADHGNAEQMTDPETGLPHTAHTTFDVDLIVVDDASKGKKLREGGRLADVAPTLLDLLGFPKPAEMTGESLLQS